MYNLGKYRFREEKLSIWLNQIIVMKTNKFLRWWSNLPIHGKQLIGLFASEVISVFGLVGVGAFLIVIGGRCILVNQAKSELAVTEVNYGIWFSRTIG